MFCRLSRREILIPLCIFGQARGHRPYAFELVYRQLYSARAFELAVASCTPLVAKLASHALYRSCSRLAQSALTNMLRPGSA